MGRRLRKFSGATGRTFTKSIRSCSVRPRSCFTTWRAARAMSLAGWNPTSSNAPFLPVIETTKPRHSPTEPTMHIAVLSAGAGWHVRDLQRAATLLHHEAVAVDFRRIQAGVRAATDSLAHFEGVLVRTMPPGSLEQVIFRMDVL